MFKFIIPTNFRAAQLPWQLFAVLFGCIPFTMVGDVNKTSRGLTITKLLSFVLPLFYSISSVAFMLYAMHTKSMNFNQHFTPTFLSKLVYFAQLVVFEICITTICVHSMICWPRLNAVLEQIYQIDVHFLDKFKIRVDYKHTWRHGGWCFLFVAASTAGLTVLALVLRSGFSSHESELNMWVCFLITYTHILGVTLVMIFSSIATQIRNRIRLLIQVKNINIERLDNIYMLKSFWVNNGEPRLI